MQRDAAEKCVRGVALQHTHTATPCPGPTYTQQGLRYLTRCIMGGLNRELEARFPVSKYGRGGGMGVCFHTTYVMGHTVYCTSITTQRHEAGSCRSDQRAYIVATKWRKEEGLLLPYHACNKHIQGMADGKLPACICTTSSTCKAA